MGLVRLVNYLWTYYFFSVSCQILCIRVVLKKKQKTVCEGEFECKKGCENCTGRIFLKHKNSKV